MTKQGLLVALADLQEQNTDLKLALHELLEMVNRWIDAQEETREARPPVAIEAVH